MILFTLNEINKVQQPLYIPTHGPRTHAWGFEKMKSGEGSEGFEVDKTVDIFDPLTRNRSGCNTIKHVS